MPTAALYDLADRLHALAPWEVLEETDIIRVIHPGTGESGYVSIMGSLGQHRSFTIYLGEEALRRFNLMQADDPIDPEFPELDSLGLILETRQLQVSFGNRAELRNDELANIKKLGRKYRGNNWPMFRSFKPGYAPGAPDEQEIDWMTICIGQLINSVPDVFLRQWEKAGIRPASIRVCTITTYSMLEIARSPLNYSTLRCAAPVACRPGK